MKRYFPPQGSRNAASPPDAVFCHTLDCPFFLATVVQERQSAHPVRFVWYLSDTGQFFALPHARTRTGPYFQLTMCRILLQRGSSKISTYWKAQSMWVGGTLDKLGTRKRDEKESEKDNNFFLWLAVNFLPVGREGVDAKKKKKTKTTTKGKKRNHLFTHCAIGLLGGSFH